MDIRVTLVFPRFLSSSWIFQVLRVLSHADYTSSEMIFRTTVGDDRESLCESIVLQSIPSVFFTMNDFSICEVRVSGAVVGLE